MSPTEQVRPVSGLNTSAELRYDDPEYPPTIKMPEIFLIMGRSNLNIYFTSLVKTTALQSNVFMANSGQWFIS